VCGQLILAHVTKNKNYKKKKLYVPSNKTRLKHLKAGDIACWWLCRCVGATVSRMITSASWELKAAASVDQYQFSVKDSVVRRTRVLCVNRTHSVFRIMLITNGSKKQDTIDNYLTSLERCAA